MIGTHLASIYCSDRKIYYVWSSINMEEIFSSISIQHNLVVHSAWDRVCKGSNPFIETISVQFKRRTSSLQVEDGGALPPTDTIQEYRTTGEYSRPIIVQYRFESYYSYQNAHMMEQVDMIVSKTIGFQSVQVQILL